MPLAFALEALKAAYRGQCSWLSAWSKELEAGEIRVIRRTNGSDVDITDQTAADFRHRAGNLEGIIVAYERLASKET
jgi:hypothetical protein